MTPTSTHARKFTVWTRLVGACAHILIVSLGLAIVPIAAFAAVQQPAANADTSWDFTRPLTGRSMPCEQGKIKIFTCENIELLSYLPAESLAHSAGNDLWGWRDSATQREFVIMGEQATAFVEVTDPLHPKYLGFLPSPDSNHAAQSVKVYKNHAFIAYEQSKAGIQVFDLTQLRDVKRPQEFRETAHYGGLDNSHTIAINPETGFAYVSGTNTCNAGLHILDVRTPTKPVFAGCYPANASAERSTDWSSYVHDTQCVIYRGPDTTYRGREICATFNGSAMEIVDVTDKREPKMISSATYPNAGYVHQGWFTEDQRSIYIDDEFDENQALARVVGLGIPGDTTTFRHTRTIGFDVSDLDDPALLTEFYNTTFDTDHNLYIRGQYMYQGNNGAGLRVIDVADPKHPKEVGYLAGIGAAWGTYPFLSNDVVAVPTPRGLFLARLKTPSAP